MIKLKLTSSRELLKKQLQNEEFKEEYDRLQEEFTVAKQIIKLRKEANLTQKELAEKAHTSQSAIARAESGEYKNLSLAFLRKIGEVFGVVPKVSFKKIA